MTGRGEGESGGRNSGQHKQGPRGCRLTRVLHPPLGLKPSDCNHLWFLKVQKGLKKQVGLRSVDNNPGKGEERRWPHQSNSTWESPGTDEGPPHTGRAALQGQEPEAPKQGGPGQETAESTPVRACAHTVQAHLHLEAPARRANATPMDNHGPVVPEDLAQCVPDGPEEPGPALGPPRPRWRCGSARQHLIPAPEHRSSEALPAQPTLTGPTWLNAPRQLHCPVSSAEPQQVHNTTLNTTIHATRKGEQKTVATLL